jgi:hypothetical protein
MFVRPLALLFFDVLVSFGILMFCKLPKENCGLNVEDANKLKKGISRAGIERSTLALEHICTRAQKPYARAHLHSSSKALCSSTPALEHGH